MLSFVLTLIFGILFIIFLCNGISVRVISFKTSRHYSFNSQQSSNYQLLTDTSQYAAAANAPQYTPPPTESYQSTDRSSGVLSSASLHLSRDDSSDPLPSSPLHPPATNHSASFYGSTEPPLDDSVNASQHSSPDKPPKSLNQALLHN